MFKSNGYLVSNRTLFTFALAAYHLLFVYIFINYTSINGGDSSLYWFKTPVTHGYSWSQLFYYGNKLMCWFNYPFAVLLKLPIWVGYVLYGIVGLMGILQFYKLVKLVLGDRLIILGYNVLPIIAFMPNLHFWTAGITKEVLCFYAIATMLLQLQLRNLKSWSFIGSCALLVGIRPHVALMFLVAFGAVYLWTVSLSRTRKITLSIAFCFLAVVLYVLVCNIIHINPLDWERWLVNNKNWRDSFIESGSYVHIDSWNIPYQLFSFNFRPFFYDIHHHYSWILSIENLVLFTLYITAFIQTVRFRLFKINNVVIGGIILFNLIGSLIYMQRYAGLGIFVRTKMMFQPFMVIVLFYILIKTIPQLSKHDKA